MKSMSVSKVIKTLDFFSQPFRFKINDQKSIKSFLGGFMTLSLIGILLFFAYMFGNDIFFKQKPNVIMQNEVLSYSPYVNFTQNNSIIAFRLEDDNGYVIKNYANYINISISFDMNEPLDGGYKALPIPLNFGPCHQNSTLSFLFNKSIIHEYFCILDYNMNIGGFWGLNEIVNFLKIQVYSCQNTTENNNSCEIFRPELKYYFSLYFSDGKVNMLNIESPIEYRLTNIYTLLDPDFYKITSLKYSNLEVLTDTGFLLKTINNSTSSYLDIIINDFLTKKQNPLAKYYLYLSNKKQTIVRSYIKLQDIGAQLGGITEILKIIITLLLIPFQEKQVNVKLMNQLFRYSQNELGTKKKSITDLKQSVNTMKITRKRNLIIYPMKTESEKNFESNERRVVLSREKLKEEKINDIIEEIKSSKRFKFSKCELLISVYLCKFFHSNKIIAKDILIDKSTFQLNKFLNVNVLFEKIMEFDILKYLIFNEEQMMVFNFIEKPRICIEETKIQSNFSKMIEKPNLVNRESAQEIINYFLKFSKQELKNSNSIDSKLYEILHSNLRSLIFSLR